MSHERRRPTAFRLDREEAPEAPPKAGRRPAAVPMAEITIEAEAAEQPGAAELDPMPVARTMRWGALFVTALAGIASLWAGLAIIRLIEDLLARSAVLGWIAAGLAAVVAIAALAVILREIVGLVRLARLGSIREDAARALNEDDGEAAAATIAALRRIYGGRRDTARALARLAEHEREVIDPGDRIRLAETDLMAPLDEAAGRLIARAARRVMLLTAITPAAALDILFVAAQNLRLLREIATLYGGRPGLVGTARLARMVVAHLAAAGALAMSDQLLPQIIGHGVLGRLSARFGEGAVNGALTARIGLAALDLCRPLPFAAARKPGLAEFLSEVVTISNRPAGRTAD